jgi:hypothetical protein
MVITAAQRVSATTSHPMRRAGDFTVGSVPDPAPVAASAVVQTEPPLRSAPTSRVARPEAPFLAQLIATAEQDPQTRALRRADVAVVNAAYRAASTPVTGSLTRRII